jgi:hypothetical protein
MSTSALPDSAKPAIYLWWESGRNLPLGNLRISKLRIKRIAFSAARAVANEFHRRSFMITKSKQTVRWLLCTVLVSAAFTLFFAPQRPARATVLSDTVTAMAPGTWAIITPNNTSVLNSNNTVYADRAVWDTVNRKFVFTGAYHADTLRTYVYDEITNSWTNATPPTAPSDWLKPAPGAQVGAHAYGTNTVDESGNAYFRVDESVQTCVNELKAACTNFFKYNIATNTWSYLPPIAARVGYETCCDPLVYFPELSSLMFFDGAYGRIWRYNLSTSTWSLWATNSGYNNNGGGTTWSFAIYNPALKEIIYSSAAASQHIYKIDSGGNISDLGQRPPYNFYNGSGFASNFTVDPISGKYILIENNDSALAITTVRVFDSRSNTWTTTVAPPADVRGSIATAYNQTHGVTMTLVCGATSTASCDGKLAIYKHSTGSGTPPPPTPAPIVSLTANPSSISSGTASTLIWSSTYASSCTASGGWSGTKSVSGSQTTGSLTANTTFALTCTGAGGSAAQSVSVAVSSSTSTPPPSSTGTTLLVKFGQNSSLNNFGLGGWSTVIKDLYTDYQDIGPGGTTIVTGGNQTYNYQGVTGAPRSFAAGEKIRVNWFNNSPSSATFIPNISFTDPDRIGSGAAGAWYPMTSVTVPPFASATSEYAFTSASAGSYSLVNVNVNYANTLVIIADKIELLGSGSGTTTTFDYAVSNGGNRSVAQGQAVSNTIAANLLSGTGQTVTFSTTGLPAGVAASFSLGSCSPTCTSNLTLSTASSSPAGTYPITVTAVSGSLSKTTAVSLTVTTGSTSTSTTADADYQARCSAAGVVKCWGFDNPATDLVLNKNIFAGTSTTPSQDTAVKTSGTGALKFTLPPPPNGGANMAGKWEPQGQYGDYGLGREFGPGTSFYVQFRMRLSPEMLTNTWDSSWKFFELLWNNSQCGNTGLIFVNKSMTRTISGYSECGGRIIGVAGPGGYVGPPAPPYSIQQFDDGRTCDYPEWYTANHPDCLYLKSNVWMTFTFKVDVGSLNKSDGRIQAWYSDETTPVRRFIDTGFTYPIIGPASGGTLNTANFSTYMTSLSPTSGLPGVTSYMWIDEFIVSTQPIAQPGVSSSSSTPPSPPSSLVLK